MPTYDLIRIRGFLAERVDLRDFCFVLQHRITSEYAFRALAGDTPAAKSLDLIQKAEAYGQVGEVVLQLTVYWLDDIRGNPRVLVQEEIHEDLLVFRQELLAREDADRATHVEHILARLEVVVEVLVTRRRPSEPQPGEPSTPPEVVLSLRFMPQDDGSAQVLWEADAIGWHTSTFRPPYDADTLPVVIKALDAAQWPTRPHDGPQFDQSEQNRLTALGLWLGDWVVAGVHQRVGREIYAALTADPEGQRALHTMRDHTTALGRPLAYLLRFSPEATDLAAYPWELLWDEAGALLLSRGRLACCTRYLDLGFASPPPIPSGAILRILAVVPNAGIPAEVHAEERAARVDAWSDLISAGIVEMEELSPATPKGLVDRIQAYPPVDVIHFYGHGCYKDGQGALLFDALEGDEEWVNADRLAALLGEARLVMLHACQSAMVGDAGLLTGVAPALSAAGVPAVVAMQLTVRVKAATRFAEVVYRHLARGESVQRAVSLARQALYVEESAGASWYVPTLTIRARDTGPLRLIEQRGGDTGRVKR